MDDKNQNLDLFDAYLRGAMDAGTKDEFEARIADEPAFRKAFEYHQRIRESLKRNAELQPLRDQIGTFRKELLARQKKNSAIKLLLGIAAVLVLLAASWFFFSGTDKAEPTTPNTDSPVPIATDENRPADDEPLVGSGRKPVIQDLFPVTELDIVNGKPVLKTGADSVQLVIYQHAEENITGNKSLDIITIYFPDNQSIIPATIKLLTITYDHKPSIYLKHLDTFYQIPMDETTSILPVENDPKILSWLNYNQSMGR